MKISSHQFLKAFLVGAGLIAVLIAYRSDSKNAASNDLFYADSGDIRLNMPLDQVGDSVKVVVENTVDQPVRSSPEAEIALDVAEVETALPKLDDDSISSLPDPRWFDADSVKAEVENEVMKIAEGRERDAFEDLDAAEESQIPAQFDGLAKTQPANFVENAPEAAPNPAQLPVALNDAAALKAVHHIEYGKSLARRSATEAAGQEFLGALRVLAESNDVATGGTAYVTGLRNGLQAMKEAGDFKTADPQRQIALNVANAIEGHQTKIISVREAEQMTASTATRRYLEYAGFQLGTCAGQNPVAAEALYCLGKMRSISALSNPDPESKELYEAIIFQHAALTADPKNHRSANELGVLLARSGQLAAAETYLKNSLQLKPTPEGWANLAKVHQRKGTPQDQQLANLAMQEYQASVNRQMTNVAAGPIQLVEPQEFLARSPMQHPDASPTTATGPEVVPVSNFSEEKPSFVQRIGSFLAK